MSLTKRFFIICGVFLLTLGIFLRFYNLVWGAPFYFHPDERNIVYAIQALSFPTHLNPHFFAYGSFPIYTTYFTAVFFSISLIPFKDFAHIFHQPTFELIIFVSRAYSSLLSLGIALSLFYIGKKIYNTQTGIYAGLLALFSTGFIQYAHFGTFEMWLTFFSLWFFYFWYLFHTKRSKKALFILGILGGLLMGIKVSSLPLLFLPMLSCIFHVIQKKNRFRSLLLIIPYGLLISIAFTLTNPFAFLDMSSFLNSIHYESGVAMGTIPVFYTQSFVSTIPILFQFLHVFPFLLNPFITAAFVVACIVFFVTGKQYISGTILVVFFFFVLFCSQAFLYVKWTRYMVVALPYVYLLLSSCLTTLPKKIRIITFVFLLLVSITYSFAYAKTVFFETDSRINATLFAKKYLSSETHVLTEPYDLGVLPFQTVFLSMKYFPFYDLDQNPQFPNLLAQTLTSTDVIILPSQRLYRARLLSQSAFPRGYAFYHALFDGTLGFTKLYQTPCNIFCSLETFGSPVFAYEETTSIFDHPTVFIFTKKKQQSEAEYLKILQK